MSQKVVVQTDSKGNLFEHGAIYVNVSGCTLVQKQDFPSLLLYLTGLNGSARDVYTALKT